ncbi:hypothetical protein MTO96_018176 [Rhipicephalus appendiculatus]
MVVSVLTAGDPPAGCSLHQAPVSNSVAKRRKRSGAHPSLHALLRLLHHRAAISTLHHRDAAVVLWPSPIRTSSGANSAPKGYSYANPGTIIMDAQVPLCFVLYELTIQSANNG